MVKFFSRFACGVAMSFLLYGNAAAAPAEPELRIGILSDAQCPKSKDSWGLKNARRGFELLRQRGVDVVVLGGDLAERGDAEVFYNFLEAFDSVFGEKKPELISIMGNHEFSPKIADPKEKIAAFAKAFGLPADANVHRVIGGYDFIAISPEGMNQNTYKEGAEKFVKEAVASARKRAAGKPIFAFSHHPLSDTVAESGQWGSDSLKKVWDFKLPDLVHFSGHTHHPLQDERSIFQDEFTMVNTSSLCYLSRPGNYANVKQLHDTWKYPQMLFVDVYADHIDIIRMALDCDREIKPGRRWRLELPLSKENFTYTAARRDSRKAPEFPAGSEAGIKVSGTKEGKPVIAFPAAVHDDFVHGYAMKFIPLEADGKPGKSFELNCMTDYYRGIDRMAENPAFALPPGRFRPGTRYRVEIRPCESFGKRGSAISAEFQF